MDYYQPKLANNQPVLLTIQLKAFKVNFLWPLQENATPLQRYLRILGQTCLLICYVATLFAEICMIMVHFREISLIIESVVFVLLGIQYFIRAIVLGLRQKRMRQYLEYFYKEIYFTSSDDSVLLYDEICRTMRIIGIVTILYCAPMFLKTIDITIELAQIGLSSPTKPYWFNFIFVFYDAQDPVAYVLTMIYTGWHPFSFLSLRAAEDYLLCLILIHTSYRYKELQQELRNMLSAARLESERLEGGLGCIHAIFRKRLYIIFQRQQRLDIFVNMTKSYLSYHVFYSIAFGIALLCVVCFRLQIVVFDDEAFRLCCFLISQTVQICMLGHFGQILWDETMAMHDAYYMCQWELILVHGDVCSNKALMNDIKLALLNAERGSVLIGMNMFPLSHITVLMTLRKAASYFMFLKTVNDV